MVFLLEYSHFPKELTEQIHVSEDRVHTLPFLCDSRCLVSGHSRGLGAWHTTIMGDIYKTQLLCVILFLSVGLRLTTTLCLSLNLKQANKTLPFLKTVSTNTQRKKWVKNVNRKFAEKKKWNNPDIYKTRLNQAGESGMPIKTNPRSHTAYIRFAKIF